MQSDPPTTVKGSSGQLSHEYRRHFEGVMLALEENEGLSCIRAIPAVIPIRKVTHEILQRRGEESGVLDEQIISALRLLKQATVDELDGLLMLGLNRTRTILDKLARHGNEVRRLQGGSYEAGDNGTQKMAGMGSEGFVKHDRTFLVNGLTGDLLPIDFWSHQRPHVGSNCWNSLGDRYKNVVSIPVNPRATGNEMLDKVIQVRDMRQWKTLGVPESTEARDSSGAATVLKLEWVRAFLLVMPDSTVHCYTASSQPLPLALPGSGRLDYIESVARNFVASKSVEEFIKDTRVHLTETDEPGLFDLTVDRPDLVLGFPTLSADIPPGIACYAFSDMEAIMRGTLWGEESSWAYVRLRPGNKDTAERLCLLSGISRLRQRLTTLGPSEPGRRIDIKIWWEQFQANFLESVPDHARGDLIPIEKLAAHVRRETPDAPALLLNTEFLELFNSCYGYTSQQPKIGKESKGGSRLVRSSVGDTGILQSLLGAMSRAKHSIYLISPMCEHPQVKSQLVAKRSLQVNVVTEIRERNKRHTLVYKVRSPLDTEENVGNKLQHIRNLRLLGRHQVRCRGTKAYPHAKLVIVDRQTVIFTSANLSPNSLGGGDSPSVEAGLFIQGHKIVESFCAMFEAIWNHASIRQHFHGNTVSICEEALVEDVFDLEPRSVDGLTLCVNYPPKVRDLTEQIIRDISNANDYVLLSALSIYETQKMESLHQELILALERGVKVLCAVRENHGFGDKWPDESTLELAGHGIQFIPHLDLHAKGILVDDKRCGIFSANLNPYSLNSSSETAHLEMGLFGPAEHSVMAPYTAFLRELASGFYSI